MLEGGEGGREGGWEGGREEEGRGMEGREGKEGKSQKLAERGKEEDGGTEGSVSGCTCTWYIVCTCRVASVPGLPRCAHFNYAWEENIENDPSIIKTCTTVKAWNRGYM